MATHSKRVDRNVPGIYQVFSNDTSLSDAVTFATGDYIDFFASLGRAARKVTFVLQGAVDVTFRFNVTFTATKGEEYVADTEITMTEATANVNSMRLFGGAGDFITFETPEGFTIKNMKLVAYSGAPDASNNLTIIGF